MLRSKVWTSDSWSPPPAAVYVAIAVFSVILWLSFRHSPPVPDVAWLLEGARRWVSGARLYVDIREINPPLIFYEMVALSGGVLTPSAFVAGVTVATAISSFWVGRHHGPLLGFGAFLSIVLAGMVEFGQREHLLLIFVIPYLLARGSRWERAAMGLWAFFGVALKPYYLLVVALPALVELARDRRSLFDTQKIALGLACAAYVAAAYFIYPSYFRDLVPHAQAAYTIGLTPRLPVILQTVLIASAFFLADAERRPLAAAAIGGLLSYYIQGRFWYYHFITAAGLGMLVFFWMQRLRLWAVLVLFQAFHGPHVHRTETPIPAGVRRVAILSARPMAAYPAVTGCGATNVLPYASLGWVPGPWNIASDPRRAPAERQRAWKLLMVERERLRRAVIASGTEVIIAESQERKVYFDRPFDYMRFLGPFPGYVFIRRIGKFDLWARHPISPRLCRERY